MRRIIGIAIAAAVAGVSAGIVGVPPAGADTARQGTGPLTGRRVLLTNDDGAVPEASPTTLQPGLQALRAAMCEAGAEVTVVAPASDRSGGGASFTPPAAVAPQLSLAQVTLDPPDLPACGPVWRVGGTPADSAYVGLLQVMADDPPDIVVSGANPGVNVGAQVISSGTVGAAQVATALGVPAIAFSSFEELPARKADLPGIGAFTVRLLTRLVKTQRGDGPLLPRGVTPNVNYPYGRTSPTAVFTTISPVEPLQWGYTPVGGGLQVTFKASCAPVFPPDAACPTSPKGSDTRAVSDGRISVTLLTAPYASPKDVARLRARLAGLVRSP